MNNTNNKFSFVDDIDTIDVSNNDDAVNVTNVDEIGQVIENNVVDVNNDTTNNIDNNSDGTNIKKGGNLKNKSTRKKKKSKKKNTKKNLLPDDEPTEEFSIVTDENIENTESINDEVVDESTDERAEEDALQEEKVVNQEIVDDVKKEDIREEEQEVKKDVQEEKDKPTNDKNPESKDTVEELDFFDEDEEEVVDNLDEMDTYIFSEEDNAKIQEENNTLDKKEIEKKIWSQNTSTHRFHFSFQSRIACLITGILVLFISACLMIFDALRINSFINTSYTDFSNTDYKVVLLDGVEYKSGLLYASSLIDKVNIHFRYEAEFEDEVNYDMNYRVVLYNKIYNGKKLIFSDNDVIIKKDTGVKNGNRNIYTIDVPIDYQKYNDFVLSYNNYSSKNSSLIDIVLYVDTKDGSKEVSNVSIPLVNEMFKIEMNSTEKSSHDIRVELDNWSNTNTLIIVIGSLLILLSILLFTRLTRLVLLTLKRKNKYELTLVRIFNEYDKYLVVARGGYESDIVKNVVKVDSFKEMLNVREILNKPIIFSKINNVKSEFIIDDDDLIYKYVLKEADVEK